MSRSYDFFTVQNQLIVAHFVGASTVPDCDRQNTTAVGHWINVKLGRSSTRCIRQAKEKRLQINARRVADEPLVIILGCL